MHIFENEEASKDSAELKSELCLFRDWWCILMGLADGVSFVLLQQQRTDLANFAE